MFWINNPTREEADLAIANGATGCTLNPSYTQKMIDHATEGPYALALLDEVIREVKDDKDATVVLQRRLAQPILERFLPMYEKAPETNGHVSLQGDPFEDDDADAILHQAWGDRAVSPNVTIKIPCIPAGLSAMDTLVRSGVPVNVTEVFAYCQSVTVCEVNERARRTASKAPPVYLSHITGIYDDYLAKYSADHNVDISGDTLWQAGLVVARKVYQLMIEKGYNLTLIGGGARGLHHFTEMVGARAVVTINWKGTADELVRSDPPVVYRVFNPVPQGVVDELLVKLPDFRRGWIPDGLKIEEYAGFGPVQLFRSMFVKSWQRVLDVIKQRRAASVPVH
jgi:transaldolase